jgi:hypothetical protein
VTFFSILLAFINGFCNFEFDFVLTFEPGVVCDPPYLSDGISVLKDHNQCFRSVEGSNGGKNFCPKNYYSQDLVLDWTDSDRILLITILFFLISVFSN